MSYSKPSKESKSFDLTADNCTRWRIQMLNDTISCGLAGEGIRYFIPTPLVRPVRREFVTEEIIFEKLTVWRSRIILFDHGENQIQFVTTNKSASMTESQKS